MPVYKEKSKKRWTKDGRAYYFREYYIDQYGIKKQYRSEYYIDREKAEEERAKWLLQLKIDNDTSLNISFKEVYEEWYVYKSMTLKCTTAYKLKKSLDKNILN